MGMFDEVEFATELPGLPDGCRRFQTKSLDSSLDHYVVTKAGRLCLAGSGWDSELPPSADAVALDTVDDVDFHGDLRLVPSEGEYAEYIARFTHGTLEWVRRMEEGELTARGRAQRKRFGGPAKEGSGGA